MFRDRLAYKGTEVARIVHMYNINYDDEKMILGYLQENKIKYECDTVVFRYEWGKEVEINGITSSALEIAFEKESDYYFFIAFLSEQVELQRGK